LPLLAREDEPSSAGEDQPAELETLVVSAALEPLSVRDVASSITIITREEIEQRQAKYLGELLRDVPGFSVSQSGGYGAQTQIRVRGAEANQMLVLIDGIRANDPASADEFQFQYALTTKVERIEIIRGPQSSIWGSDAMAGVINIIRRKDVPETWVSGSAEVGSHSTINAAVDGGIAGNGFRLQGGVAHFQTDGINISRMGDEKDGSENTTANLGLEWDIGEAWSFLASGQHVSAETEFDEIDFFDTGLPTDSDRVTEAERNYLRAELRYAPHENHWSGNGSINYTDSDNENFSDGISDSATAAEVLDARLRGSVLLGSMTGDQDHRLTGGLDFIDTKFAQRGITLPWGDPNQEQDYNQSSVAAEYIGKILDISPGRPVRVTTISAISTTSRHGNSPSAIRPTRSSACAARPEPASRRRPSPNAMDSIRTSSLVTRI
jgi:vitamin B12 transporter